MTKFKRPSVMCTAKYFPVIAFFFLLSEFLQALRFRKRRTVPQERVPGVVKRKIK